MKFEATIDSFLSSLNLIKPFVTNKPSNDIFLSIFLKVSNNELYIVATDGNSSITQKTPASNLSDGEVALPFKNIFSLFSVLNKNDVFTFSKEKNIVKIKVGEKNFTFRYVNNEYTFPFNKFDKQNIILPFNFTNIYTKSKLESENKDRISSKLIVKNSKLVYVSTDKIRLTYVEDVIKTEKNIDQEIPSDFLAKIHKTEFNYIDYSEDKKEIILGNNDTVVTSRVVDNSFPNFLNLISNLPDSNIKVNKKSFLDSLSALNTFGDEVVTSVTIEKNNMQLKVKNNDIGDAEDKLIIVNDFDKKISFSVRVKFIIERLETCESEYVNISILTPSNPVYLHWEDSQKVIVVIGSHK